MSMSPRAHIQTKLILGCLASFLLGVFSSDTPLPQPVVTPSSAPPAVALDIKLGDPILDIRDPDLLKKLENYRGPSFSLDALLSHTLTLTPQTPVGDLTSNAALYAHNAGYRILADRLASDMTTLTAQLDIPTVKINAAAKKFSNGNVARQIDERWLQSPWGYFLLTGIINRYDRKDFNPTSSCGEVRFIYRLAYQREESPTHTYKSRMPFFLNLVFDYPHEQDCTRIARLWQPPQYLSGESLAEWLRRHPLNLESLRFKQLELNAQIVRLPAGLIRDLGGEAIYLLRIYTMRNTDNGPVIESKWLENTPNVVRLNKDPILKKQLIAFIRDHLPDIDRGTFILPDIFLDKHALSFSTLGNMRLANKPFDAIFSENDGQAFSDIDFNKLNFIKSPQGLIERLNNATCMGCHQGNSTAGFHFLGLDRDDFTTPTNHIRIGVSPHYQAELARRSAYLSAALGAHTPNSFRPLSYAPPATWQDVSNIHYHHAPVNGACLTNGDSLFTEAHQWSCTSPEMECKDVVSNAALHAHIGQCVPKREHSDLLFAGQTCRAGTLKNIGIDYESTPSDTLPFNFFAFKDRFDSHQLYDLRENKIFTTHDYNCRPTEIGVPLGRTFRNCTENERQLSNIDPSHRSIPSEICAFVGGSAFDRCAEGNFHDCLSNIVVRGTVDTCFPDRPCREDYICQSMPLELTNIRSDIAKRLDEENIGFCTPTYFIYQMRLDGHITPF